VGVLEHGCDQWDGCGDKPQSRRRECGIAIGHLERMTHLVTPTDGLGDVCAPPHPLRAVRRTPVTSVPVGILLLALVARRSEVVVVGVSPASVTSRASKAGDDA
jgi:hypothetical protein